MFSEDHRVDFKLKILRKFRIQREQRDGCPVPVSVIYLAVCSSRGTREIAFDAYAARHRYILVLACMSVLSTFLASLNIRYVFTPSPLLFSCLLILHRFFWATASY